MSDTNKTKEAQLAEEKAAKTADEIRAYASESGVELSDEDLERVSGGFGEEVIDYKRCNRCRSSNLSWTNVDDSFYGWTYVCLDCGHSASENI